MYLFCAFFKFIHWERNERLSVVNCSLNSQNFCAAHKISERIPHLSADELFANKIPHERRYISNRFPKVGKRGGRLEGHATPPLLFDKP